MGLDTQYTALGARLLRKQESEALVGEASLLGMIRDRTYLKHSLVHLMEYRKLVDHVPDSYYDELEERLLTWD